MLSAEMMTAVAAPLIRPKSLASAKKLPAFEQALQHQRHDQEEQDELPLVELGVGPALVLWRN